MTTHWSRDLVTIEDLLAFRAYLEALRPNEGEAPGLPPRVTVRAAAYRAVKQRLVLGDMPSDPRHAARGLDQAVHPFWRGPDRSGTSFLKQTADFFSDLLLDNSSRRAAGLVAGLYGTMISDASHTLVLALNVPSDQPLNLQPLAPRPGADQRLAVYPATTKSAVEGLQAIKMS